MLLALDTSTSFVSLALMTGVGPGAEVIEEREEGLPRKQSELLPQMIHTLLQDHGLEPPGLEGIAVGLGPGSFTGLRVGLATVKGLAYALKLRVAGVSSLAGMAHATRDESRMVVAVAVARAGELYAAAYERTGEGVELRAREEAVMVSDFAAYLSRYPGARVVGPGLQVLRGALIEAQVPAECLGEAMAFPPARSIAALAKLSETYDSGTLFALEPHYVKSSGAERNPKFPPLPGPVPTARIREDE